MGKGSHNVLGLVSHASTFMDDISSGSESDEVMLAGQTEAPLPSPEAVSIGLVQAAAVEALLELYLRVGIKDDAFEVLTNWCQQLRWNMENVLVNTPSCSSRSPRGSICAETTHPSLGGRRVCN